jgi:THO complex subunit 2
MERLNEKTIFDCKFVEQIQFDRKRGRIYTKINFEQNKYNLSREANEGYSKIILLLLSVKDSDDLTKLYKNIVCLIGNFDLDPDRVIDLILESFIQNPFLKIYPELLKNF